MGKKKAQAAIEPRSAAARRSGQAAMEFMVAVSIILLILAISTAIYIQNSEEAAKLRDHLQANSICMTVSSSISAVASSGAGMNMTLRLPATMNGLNYTVRVSDEKNTIKVDYSSYGVGCQVPELTILNSTGAHLFAIGKNAAITYNGADIIVVP